MARKVPNTWKVLNMFLPVWSQAYSGEEYEPDGRDWNEIKTFLEIHPDILQKREIFVQRAMRFLDDDFWNKPDGQPQLCHQIFFFLRHYARYGNPKKTSAPKKKSKCAIHSLEYEGNFCPKCFVPVEEEKNGISKD